MPDVEIGAFVSKWTWGLDNIAAISMTSSGVVWYDFTEFMDPKPLAKIDVNAVSNTYTSGSRSAKPTTDKYKWMVHDITEDHDNFYFIHLEEPGSEGCVDVMKELEVLGEQLNSIQIDTTQCFQYGYDYGA